MNSPTRRSFLKTSTTALAATISARTAFGSQANSRIKVGVVGCGGRGGLIAKMFVENGYFEIGGAADYFADKALKLGSSYQLGADRAFSGLECAEKMIAKGGLDAIAIISPPYFHPAQAKAAVDARLHVYLAKPVAVDVPGIQSVRTSGEQARAKKRVFLIDFQTRTDSFFIEAMKRVQAGALGDLAFGEARYHSGRLKPKGTGTTPEDRLNNWVFDKALSGDIVLEQNIHTLDMMSWAFGNTGPLKATATCARRVRVDVGDANDTFSGLLEYPNQVGVTFSSRQFDAQGAPGGIKFDLYGSKGALLSEYGGNVIIRGGADTFYRGGENRELYRTGISENMTTFHKAITEGDFTNSTLEPSLTSNLTSLLVRSAAYKGHAVTWQELLADKDVLTPDLKGLLKD